MFITWCRLVEGRFHSSGVHLGAESGIVGIDTRREVMSKVSDDRDWCGRIRARDLQILSEVVHQYLGQVLRAARGAGLDAVRAEDVTQTTFVTFIERAAEFEGRSHVRTWLFGILYKKIAEERRKLRRDENIADIEEIVEARFNPNGTWMRPPRATDAEVYEREVREGLANCLETLPAAQRSAFVLREVEGFATSEICKILEVTATNLGVLLYRARNRLRECLEGKDIRGSEGS